jgi:hypothetical protein
MKLGIEVKRWSRELCRGRDDECGRHFRKHMACRPHNDRRIPDLLTQSRDSAPATPALSS